MALTQMGSANMMVVRGSRAAVATELAVLVNPAVPDYTGVVIDRNPIVSAHRQVKVTNSEHAVFASDSVLLSGQRGDSVTLWCCR